MPSNGTQNNTSAALAVQIQIERRAENMGNFKDNLPAYNDRMRLWFGFILIGAAFGQWTPQTSNTTASLRGVSAVSSMVAWASGTQGTYLRTLDGGRTWEASQVSGAESLDFRDIQAFDANHAYLMSAGPGPQSRVYKTSDGGVHWSMVLRNENEKGFFDAIAFWDLERGLAMGDPVDGRVFAATTLDGGATWKTVYKIAPARSGEGGFAASGTCLIVGPKGSAWIATGGTGGSRVYRSTDYGRSWKVSETPIRNGEASSGIFSIAMRDRKHGVAVGGDYTKPAQDRGNIALTEDGRTWTVPAGHPRGFRSAVAYVPGTDALAAVGTNGSDYSRDGGRSWSRLDDGNYNALSFASPTAGWAAGPNGTIAKWSGITR